MYDRIAFLYSTNSIVYACTLYAKKNMWEKTKILIGMIILRLRIMGDNCFLPLTYFFKMYIYF